MRNIKFFEEFESSDFSNDFSREVHEGHEGHEMDNYMFFQNLHTLKRAIDELLELDPHHVDQILSDGHGWALDHVATSVDDVEEVYHFLANSIEMGYSPEGGHEMPVSMEETPIQVDIEGNDDKVEVEEEGEEDEDDDEDDE